MLSMVRKKRTKSSNLSTSIDHESFMKGIIMKKLTGLLLLTLAHGSFINNVIAQPGDKALVPLPSVEDFTRGNDGWGFALGAGIEYESAYEGSDEFGFEADPAGGIQWCGQECLSPWQ